MSENAHEIIEQIQAKAFQKGWNALADKIRQALEPPTSAPVMRTKVAKARPSGQPFKSGTVAAIVYEYIKQHPGLRGAEIIKNAGVENKTARTALHRMKKRGIALNNDGKWSLPE